MKNIWNMMRDLKQVDVHKYLWLALLLFLFNTAWCFLEYRVLRNPMYPNVYYHLPELFPIAFRIALIAFFIFQLKDAFGFMNKGNLERILLLPAHRFLYPIMQITFSFLCILLLWCSMSASVLVSYVLHVVSFGGLRDGLIYALLENEFLSMLLPLPWDQLLCLFVIMGSAAIALNAITLFLQAPMAIVLQCLLYIVFALFTMYNNIDFHGFSPYLAGALGLGILDVLSLFYTLYLYQHGKACGGL